MLFLTHSAPKKRKRRASFGRFAAFILLAIAIAGIAYLCIGTKEPLKIIYPQKYSVYVEKYAERFDIDENLIYAIIKIESNFNPNAESDAGAKGLMQLMDATSSECEKKLNVTADPFDPEDNIMLGTYYLSTLIDSCGSTYNAIAAYNGGLANVKRWSKDEYGELSYIPFKETEEYVKRVLDAYDNYCKLY